MTVVLSAKGWVRAAKGHDVDAGALSYREGDALLAAVPRTHHATGRVLRFDRPLLLDARAFAALGARHMASR